MKPTETYAVWIEIEVRKRDENGNETCETLAEPMDFASTAVFKSFAKASRFAHRLHDTGQQIVKEYQ